MPALTAALKDEDLGYDAAFALGAMGSAAESAVSAVLDLIRRRGRDVELAPYVLADIGSEEAIRGLCRLARGGSDRKIRESAHDAIRKNQDRVRPVLLRGLEHATADGIDEALTGLRFVLPDAEYLTILLTMAEHADPEIRTRVIDRLGEQVGDRDPRVVSVLRAALRDPCGAIRHAAAKSIEGLDEFRDETIAAWLENLSEPQECGEAISALYRLNVDVGRWFGILENKLVDADAKVRGAAVRALIQLRYTLEGSAVMPLLLRGLRDVDSDVRFNAASACGFLGAAAEPAISELIDLFDDPAQVVRAVAAWALSTIGTAAVPPLLCLGRRAAPPPRVRCAGVFRSWGCGGARHRRAASLVR